MAAGVVSDALHLSMLERGVFSARRHMYCTSSAMDERDVEHAVDALEDALNQLVPDLHSEALQLLT